MSFDSRYSQKMALNSFAPFDFGGRRGLLWSSVGLSPFFAFILLVPITSNIFLCVKRSSLCLRHLPDYTDQNRLWESSGRLNVNKWEIGGTHFGPWTSWGFLRAVCCKNRLRVCKIEKSDFLKICQNKGFGELVLKI